MKKFIVVAVLLCLMSACKTQVVGLQQHPSFDYQATMQQQFIIAGVVSSVHPLENVARLRFGDLLGRTFHEQQPHIDIIQAGHVIKSIGQESFTHMLDEYRLTGVIRNQDVNALHYAFPSARYVMLCRIEMDQVNQRHHETETDVADSEEDRKKGEYEYVRTDVSLETSREMGASLSIYDLKDHLMVWSGYVTKSDSNSNNSSRIFNKDNRWEEELVGNFVGALIGLDSNSYPKSPTRQEVLEDIFTGFAENMPEAQR